MFSWRGSGTSNENLTSITSRSFLTNSIIRF